MSLLVSEVPMAVRQPASSAVDGAIPAAAPSSDLPAAVASAALERGVKAEETTQGEEQPKVTKEPAHAAEATVEKTVAVAASEISPAKEAPKLSCTERACAAAGIERPENAAILVQEASKDAKPAAEQAKDEAALSAKTASDSPAVEGTAPSREERVATYVENKKKEILAQLREWQKDLNPYPAFYLLVIPGIVELAKADAQKMIETFERKMVAVTTVLGLKQVLEKNIEVMKSKKPKVNQETSDRIDVAIDMANRQIRSLPLKKI